MKEVFNLRQNFENRAVLSSIKSPAISAHISFRSQKFSNIKLQTKGFFLIQIFIKSTVKIRKIRTVRPFVSGR